METRTYCVYNKATESFLSVGAIVVDSIVEPWKAVKMLVDADELNVESGLWLTPFMGIPVARIFSPVDLVYLDDKFRVIHAFELFPGARLAAFAGEAASALVLPFGTTKSSRTRPGHQLIICSAEELVRHLARIAAPTAPTPVTPPAVGSVAEQGRSNGSLAVPALGNRSRRQQAAVQPPDEKAKPKSRGLPQDPAKGRYTPLTTELVRHLAETPSPTTPSPASQDIELPAEKSRDQGVLRSPLSDRRSTREPSVSRPVDETEPELLRPEELDPYASPVVLPDEGVGDPLTPVRMAAPPPPPAPQRVEPPPPQTRAASPPPILPGIRVRREPGTVQQTDKRPKVEFQPDEIDSVISQVLNWSMESQRPPARTPAPIPSAPIQPRTESRAEQLRVNAGSPPPPLDDRIIRRAPPVQRLNETQKVESRAQGNRSAMPEAVYPTEKTERPAAPVPMSTAPVPAAPSTVSKAEPLRAKESMAPSRPGDRSEPNQAVDQRSDKKEKPMPPVKGNAPVKSRFKRWADDMTAPLARGSSPTTPEQDSEETESASRKKESLQNRFMRWLNADTQDHSTDRRRSSRRRSPGLIAYYYTGGPPEPQKIGNISSTGFYMLTKERWLPDTVMRMTLQRTGTRGENPEDSLTVFTRIVRWGADGVGTEFILSETSERSKGRRAQANGTNPEALERFL